MSHTVQDPSIPHRCHLGQKCLFWLFLSIPPAVGQNASLCHLRAALIVLNSDHKPQSGEEIICFWIYFSSTLTFQKSQERIIMIALRWLLGQLSFWGNLDLTGWSASLPSLACQRLKTTPLPLAHYYYCNTAKPVGKSSNMISQHLSHFILQSYLQNVSLPGWTSAVI